MKDNYSNAGGYGFWCDEECAERNKAAGMEQLWQGKRTAQYEAETDRLLSQAVMQKARTGENVTWTPLAITGVMLGSLLGIALMVVVIKKAK